MASSGNVVWERFEEQTKLAFVGDPLHSRFSFKTRVMATRNVKVTARVSHQHTKSTSSSPLNAAKRNEAVKYVTSDMTNLSRLTRLLRFVMQEVLGAMKTLPAPTTALLSSPSQLAETAAPGNQGGNKKTHTKKKKKAAKK
uniref:SRP9 domain-containing protein n=1 Tax=Peronospora matthiolae TaxID=2874970 RepID=A0AAV1VDB5_9STRA